MKSLHQLALAALNDRSNWEQKQRIYYQMRHDGLRRKKKPYPGCSDLHYPLIDQQIGKAKPFYKNQAYTADRLAVFTSLIPNELKDRAQSAAEYFDFYVKQKTNFADELLTSIDTMLLRGFSILKVRWDVASEELVYEAIDPLFFIVPKTAKKLEDADFFVHIKHETVESYKRNPLYPLKDEATINRIKGGQDDSQTSSYEQEKAMREGLTHCNDQDTIIIWELWQRTPGGWTIHTYSPKVPGLALRRPHGCPYRWKGKTFCPFVKFDFEKKDKGWYAARGLAEKLAPYEAWLCKLWNGKSDAMDFYNKPMFAASGLNNTNNIRFLPGEIINGDITPIQMPSPPISFEEEMMQTRSVAENLVTAPDANIAPQDKGKSEFPTATQVGYQQQLATIGIDLNGWIFRLSLSELYQKTWALLVQYKPKELSYFVAEDLKILPQEALHDQYHIMPDGSPDQWNKQARQQQGMMMMQVFRGDPNVNQDELKRIVIENFDPRYVKRLWMNSGLKQATEQEDEAMEILLLEKGYPAVVEPNEDHAVRIKLLIDRMMALGQLGQPVDPVAQQRLQGHLAEHFKYFQQQNPKMAKALIQELAMMEQAGGASPAQQPQMEGEQPLV